MSASIKNDSNILESVPLGNTARSIGAYILDASENTGLMLIFVLKAIKGLFYGPLYIKNYIHQIIFIGFYSLPVVGMTAIFSGAVLALQSYTGFSRFSAESAIATVVALSIT
ncbi:MAG: ABC transporter permease, partial [Rickettsiaceae bacterium]|nr:ABC transporter permease [Rickettsiaceae bacterium]